MSGRPQVRTLVQIGTLLAMAALGGCVGGKQVPTSSPPQPSDRPVDDADSAAIMSAMSNWERGWDVYDAHLASRDYSNDADWTNAFGARRIGRDSIRALLAEVFRMPPVAAGRTEYEYHALRFITPDVAVLRSRAIREGQLLADGSSPPRHINHLRVFVKRNDKWKIISHLISDERTPGQPR